ncbi:LUD domain-containing protein [Haloferax sulfurifontis]|uniref:Lactate utilization protein C n=1 Tax=Haloferax sulfurifontis TaxID=255616 RepID=A0A830E038_9EURY|nr:LUD domain-containing protein [Haloferax sulfurifontis]GGC64432.1 lactate utilization protein C [Haloferax sulfurifontis]
MAIGTIGAFERSLTDVGVELTRATPATFSETLASVVDEPAVGTPLGFDGVSLKDTPVTTELTPRDLTEARTGVTPIGRAIAQYGTLVVESNAAGNEPVSLYPPTHVGVVRESDVLEDVTEAMPKLAEQFSDGGSVVFATGASATGDMGALVKGVHGPKTVRVVLVEGL